MHKVIGYTIMYQKNKNRETKKNGGKDFYKKSLERLNINDTSPHMTHPGCDPQTQIQAF